GPDDGRLNGIKAELKPAMVEFPASGQFRTSSYRRRTSSISKRANISAWVLGHKSGRPIIAATQGNFGANGLATSVGGRIPAIPSRRMAAAFRASNSTRRVENLSFTRETKRGEIAKGLSNSRALVTYSG